MSVTLLSSVAQGSAGQLVRFTAQTNHNPPVWNGWFFVSGLPATSGDRVRMTEVVAPATTDEVYKLTNINQEPHLIRFASVLGVNGGFFEYTLHPTNQLTDGFFSPVVNLGTKELAIEFFSIANPAVLPLQVRIKPFDLEVYTAAGLVATHNRPAGIPAGTKISMIATPPFLRVTVDGTQIYSTIITSNYPLPMGLQYSARGIADSTALGWPVGHPAAGLGLSVPAFNAAVLSGDWRDKFELDTSGYNRGVQFGTTAYNGATSLGGVSVISQGYDAAGHFYWEVLIPSTAGATHIISRFWAHAPVAFGTTFPFAAVSPTIPIITGTNPPLALQVTSPLTMTPGSTFRFTSPNYTAPQLTYTADGAGTFPTTKGQFGTGADINLFTAPTDAGTYTVTITGGGGQSSVVTIIVPVTITPTNPSLLGGATQAFTVNANVTTPATQWTTEGGTLSAQATRTCTYTAPANTGNYKVFAQTVLGLGQAIVAVTSSSSVPTAGLRLNQNQMSAHVSDTPTVSMRGDVSPPIWAIINNTRIDGSNNNLFILSNSAAADATIAQAHRDAGAILTWNFNSTMNLSPSDSARFGWQILNASNQEVASVMFVYQGSGQVYNVELLVEGSIVGGAFGVDMSAYSGGLQIEAIDQSTFTFRYRAASANAWSVLLAAITVSGARFWRFRYVPSMPSKANNSVVMAQPVLTGAWGRWLKPNWAVELVNAQNQVIGSLPYSASENTLIVSGGQMEQNCVVTCNTVGTARVYASYPSGARTVNETVITIDPATGTPVQITFPTTSPQTLDPFGTLDVDINIAEDLVLFIAHNGGSFGTSLATRSVYTAAAFAGNQYYLTVEQGSIVRRIDIIVRSKPSVSAFTVQATKDFTFQLNYVGAFSMGASAGTVAPGTPSGGYTPIIYTAPSAAGNYTITITTPFGTSTVAVTVTAVSLPPIDITTAPAVIEPDQPVLIETNYPLTEGVLFTVAFGHGSITQAGVWTLPHNAGKYTATAQKDGAGLDTVQMTVPLRITPRTPPAIAPGQEIQFQWNYPTLTVLQLSNGAGTITAAGLWKAGGTSGAFTLFARAVIGGVNFDDTINLQVSSSSLSLNYPASITVNPADQIAITSLYYPTSELTFHATRGTFVSNVYTAPAVAGSDTITVSRGAITETIAVSVRLTITPSQTTIPINTNQTITVNADVSTGGWSSPNPEITLTSPTARTVQAKSVTVPGTFFVTAVTAAGSITARLDITATGAPALTITNQDPQTVRKGATIDVLINYPIDTDVSFTATGGTFHATIRNRWIAPDTAGTYVISAHRTAMADDTLTVTVLYEIEPASTQVEPGKTVQFRANHPATSWNQVGAVGIISVDGLLTAGNTPGDFPNSIVATATGGLVAYASVAIQAAILTVYLPSHLTMQPLSTQLVGTNVSAASCQFTAHGGSFGGAEGNVYTAPEPAGDYWFTVGYQGQLVRVDVHVPLRITPDSVQLTANQTQQFHVNSASANWSLSGSGSLGDIDPVTGFYHAPPSGGVVVTVRASTASSSDTATVFFLALFPYQPNFAVEGEVDRVAAIVTSESGRQSSRVRAGILRSFSLQFLNRQEAEFRAARAFFGERYPTGGFIFEDGELAEFVACQFVSRFRFRYNSAIDQYDYSFDVREIEA